MNSGETKRNIDDGAKEISALNLELAQKQHALDLVMLDLAKLSAYTKK